MELRYVRVVLETDTDRIMLGDGKLDWSQITGPPEAMIIPQLPEALRNIAESLESGMTTGPDEDTWLEPVCGNPVILNWRLPAVPCDQAPGHAPPCGVVT